MCTKITHTDQYGREWVYDIDNGDWKQGHYGVARYNNWKWVLFDFDRNGLCLFFFNNALEAMDHDLNARRKLKLQNSGKGAFNGT